MAMAVMTFCLPAGLYALAPQLFFLQHARAPRLEPGEKINMRAWNHNYHTCHQCLAEDGAAALLRPGCLHHLDKASCTELALGIHVKNNTRLQSVSPHGHEWSQEHTAEMHPCSHACNTLSGQHFLA